MACLPCRAPLEVKEWLRAALLPLVTDAGLSEGVGEKLLALPASVAPSCLRTGEPADISALCLGSCGSLLALLPPPAGLAAPDEQSLGQPGVDLSPAAPAACKSAAALAGSPGVGQCGVPCSWLGASGGGSLELLPAEALGESRGVLRGVPARAQTRGVSRVMRRMLGVSHNTAGASGIGHQLVVPAPSSEKDGTSRGELYACGNAN